MIPLSDADVHARMIRYLFAVYIFGLTLLVIGIFLFPPAYDESLYRNFSKMLTETGRPKLSDGYFLTVHPYLVPLIQAFAILLGVESLAALRFLHAVLWVCPTFYLTQQLSRELWESDSAGFVSVLLLLGCGFFFNETLQARFDLPYTAFFLASLLALVRWIKNDGRIGDRRWWLLTLWLSLSVWTKFQGFLVCGSVVLLALVHFFFFYRQRSWERLLAICVWPLVVGLAFGIWAFWARHLGADLGSTFRSLSEGLSGASERYHTAVTEWGVVRYVVFLAALINAPLFVGGVAGLFRSLRNPKDRFSFLVWLVPTTVVAFAVGLSGIREARYFVPGIPLLCIGASVLCRNCERYMGRLLILAGFFLLVLGSTYVGSGHLSVVRWGNYSPAIFQLGALIISILGFLFSLSSKRAGVAGAMVLGCVWGIGVKDLEWTKTVPDRTLAEAAQMSATLGSVCRDKNWIGGYHQVQAFGLRCPFYDLEGRAGVELSTLRKITVWVLPKEPRYLPGAFADPEFDAWLRKHYVRSISNFKFHDLWLRRPEE